MTLVIVHVVCVILALGVGTVVALSPKGTAKHRMLGRLFSGALLGASLSSFWIVELRNGQLSIFHAVSVLVVVTVFGGLIANRRGNVWLHAMLMSFSFLMTVITGVAQFFDRLPLPSPALNAIVFLQIPSIVGFTLIWRKTIHLRTPPDPAA